PYQGQPYQGAPQQPYQGQPYQGAPQQPYQGQPYQGAPQQPYQGQPYPQQPYPGQPRQSQSGQQRKKSSKPSSSGRNPRQKQRKKHSGGIFSRLIGRILFALLTILVVIFAIYSVIALGLIKKVTYEDEGERYRTAGSLSAPYVTSVLLVGTDGRSLDERGRSDTMIHISINSRTKEITLTSIMRDCYVNIPGYGWDKLNASYSYGGAGLLMDTIEQNFHVAVDDYVSVNFISFAGIVDAVGGIDIDVSDAEAGEINTILQAEVNEIMGDDKLSDLLTSGGKLHLNGKQALSYARIRHIGNADFERTQRQREVITTVLKEIKKVKPTAISNIMNDVMPQVRSNMNTGQMYMLSLRVPFLYGYDISQLQIPAEDTYWEEYTDSGSSLGLDFDQNYRIIQEKVFADK
ncbi:MAG: LCP family protein, partial [Ruminococcus sp.]|nr:LCP family protein [Ruminococcus sp.]